jgi:hypothetical protein
VSKIDDSCREVVAGVDGAVACGVVDLASGALLGIHNAPDCTQPMDQAVAAAATRLFRGGAIGRLAQLVQAPCAAYDGFAGTGATSTNRCLHEVHVTSEHHYHFAKTICDGKAAMMLVTRKTTCLGLGWAQLRSAIPHVETLVT